MPAGVTFSQITAGFYHNCALGSNYQAYCWGANWNGQIGNDGDYTEEETPVAVQMPVSITFSKIMAGYANTCALDYDNRAYCWGSDNLGQLGNGGGFSGINEPIPVAVQMPDGVVFSKITMGTNYTCALSLGGQAFCWGSDDSGQLGDGGVIFIKTSPLLLLCLCPHCLTSSLYPSAPLLPLASPSTR